MKRFTDFEQQFNAQGIPINYAAYRSVGEHHFEGMITHSRF